MIFQTCVLFFFFFNDTATTEIYTLSLHDALPISFVADEQGTRLVAYNSDLDHLVDVAVEQRSEEHTSELQSRLHLVCRLLLEKKKSTIQPQPRVQAVADVSRCAHGSTDTCTSSAY